MDAIYDRAPQAGPDRVMLVMLPGAKARPQDLVQYGFVRALRERSLPVDVVAAEAHLGYYLERNFSAHLTQDIIAPARAENYRRIWLMGISLGGMGALMYAREHPRDIEGVILLAPFLGSRGTIAEIARAGGLAHWQPEGIEQDDDERQLLAWLKSNRPGAGVSPRIYLGYGTEDRFAAASVMLAGRLPVTQVVSIAGGHDWATWILLWQHMLDRDLFAGGKPPARKRKVTSGKMATT
jgi:pimeloyl-ACP methyl ester carboxylesterase